MDMTFANWIGQMMETIFEFLLNISPGYIVFLAVMTFIIIVIIYMRFSKVLVKRVGDQL